MESTSSFAERDVTSLAVFSICLSYGRMDMSRDRQLAPRRRLEDAQAHAGRRASHPVIALQQSAGNRAVARMLAGTRTLAREPAASGHKGPTIQIGGTTVEVEGGNIDAWAAGGNPPDVLQVTSHKGKHSAQLEHLFKDHTKTDLTLTVAAAGGEGSQLNLGSLEIQITNAQIKSYHLDGDSESWTVADFDGVHRKHISHTVGQK
jgi:hypothetical protein